MAHRTRGNHKGFTLVELLVVIGIIAMLIAVLLPTLRRARVAALQLQCSSNQRQIAMALFMYAQEHDGYMPLASYKHAPDDFNADPNGYYTTWYCRYSAGQYMHVKTRGKDFTPSSVTEGNTSKYDPAVSFLYCTAYPNHGNNSDIGIGVNIRNGTNLFTASSATVPQRRISSVRHPTQLIMLCDVRLGFTFEQAYYLEQPYYGNSSYWGGNDPSRVAYRHGNAACVTFCDGHGEVFLNTTPKDPNIGFNTGLHAAYTSGTIVSGYNK